MDKKVLQEAGKLIASFLKERRIELGLSCDDLAKLCGVSRATIWRVEENKFLPHLELFLKITHHLNCYLFLETKEE